jgi:hypothetical protein
MRTAQLLVYRFGPNAGFEGRLVGALERVEAGGAVRIAGALFVGCDPDSGDLRRDRSEGRRRRRHVGPLLQFRLEPRDDAGPRSGR